jgi:hypothetical protein
MEVFMKLKWFVLILLVTLLAACAQASANTAQNPSTPPPIDAAPSTAQPGAASSPTPEPGVVSLSSEQTQTAQTNSGSAGNSAPESPAPPIEWDANLSTVIITATNCCGLVTPFYSNNYIPDAMVWGDGRILWTQTGASGNRQVLQGKLTSSQLQNWLQSAANAGFFGWKTLYKNDNSPTDLPTRCLTINLTSQVKQVCEYAQSAPEAYQKLYGQLSQGLSVAGTPFVPQRGYLTAHPMPKVNPGNESASSDGKTPLWNDKAAGVSLADASGGIWLQGASLQQAWELVNQNPMAPSVVENGQTYLLTLQVPGVSISPPPAQ